MATNNYMIDLETLDTTPEAVIVTAAVVKFDPFDNYLKAGLTLADMDTYYARIDIENQPGRTINDDTVEWWSKQNQAAQDEAFNPEGRIPLEQALTEMHKFIWGAHRVWCQGLTFDIPMLENAYRQYKKVPPWRFWETRCSRGLQDLIAVDMPTDIAVATHDAREDCWKQIVNVQLALQKLGVDRFTR